MLACYQEVSSCLNTDETELGSNEKKHTSPEVQHILVKFEHSDYFEYQTFLCNFVRKNESTTNDTNQFHDDIKPFHEPLAFDKGCKDRI